MRSQPRAVRNRARPATQSPQRTAAAIEASRRGNSLKAATYGNPATRSGARRNTPPASASRPAVQSRTRVRFGVIRKSYVLLKGSIGTV